MFGNKSLIHPSSGKDIAKTKSVLFIAILAYLQYGTLQKLGLGHFDAWAASFGETQTAIELATEETGYRAQTRFAKFFNLPEMIALFKESADIQTPDMLKLPVPKQFVTDRCSLTRTIC